MTMKIVCSVLTIFGCAALMHSASLAAQSHPAPQQSSSEGPARTGTRDSRDAAHGASTDKGKYQTGVNPFNTQSGHPRVPNKIQGSKAGNVTKPSPPQQLSRNTGRSASGTAFSVHQPGRPNDHGAATKGGLAKNEAKKNFAVASRSSRTVSHSASMPNNQRHRGANPAEIGGWAGPNARNTAAIDGTHLSRKP